MSSARRAGAGCPTVVLPSSFSGVVTSTRAARSAGQPPNRMVTVAATSAAKPSTRQSSDRFGSDVLKSGHRRTQRQQPIARPHRHQQPGGGRGDREQRRFRSATAGSRARASRPSPAAPRSPAAARSPWRAARWRRSRTPRASARPTTISAKSSTRRSAAPSPPAARARRRHCAVRPRGDQDIRARARRRVSVSSASRLRDAWRPAAAAPSHSASPSRAS